MMRRKNHPKSKEPFLRVSRKGSLVAASVGVLGLLASIAVYLVVSQREQNILENEFNIRANELALNLRQETLGAVAVVESLAALYLASENVTPEEFTVFTAPLLKRHQGMAAIGYNSVILESERKAFEQAQQALGFENFAITEKNLAGKLVPARQRSEYVVVSLIAPLERNIAALGYDIASEPTRKEAVKRAMHSVAPAATGPLETVQDLGQTPSILLMIPLKNEDSQQTTKPVKGFSVGVFNIQQMINSATRKIISEDIHFSLHDMGIQSKPVKLGQYPTSQESKINGSLSSSHTMHVAGRVWNLQARSTPAFEARVLTQTPMNVFFCGLFFTAVVTIHLLRLNHLNNQLITSEEKFKLLAENVNAVFWIMSADMQEVHYVSPSFLHVFGHEQEEVYQNPKLFLKCIHPDDREKVTKAIRGLTYGISFQEEWRVIKPTGEQRWIFNNGFPVIHGAGDVEHIVGIASDITLQREAEAERDTLQREMTLHGLRVEDLKSDDEN